MSLVASNDNNRDMMKGRCCSGVAFDVCVCENKAAWSLGTGTPAPRKTDVMTSMCN